MRTRVTNLIREYRLRAGLTQEDLAKAVGVSRQTVNSIEAGRYIPSLPLALKLAQYFSCPTDEIFGIDESPG